MYILTTTLLASLLLPSPTSTPRMECQKAPTTPPLTHICPPRSIPPKQPFYQSPYPCCSSHRATLHYSFRSKVPHLPPPLLQQFAINEYVNNSVVESDIQQRAGNEDLTDLGLDRSQHDMFTASYTPAVEVETPRSQTQHAVGDAPGDVGGTVTGEASAVQKLNMSDSIGSFEFGVGGSHGVLAILPGVEEHVADAGMAGRGVGSFQFG